MSTATSAVAAPALPPSASGTPATLADVAGRGGQLTPAQYKLIRDVTAAYDALGQFRDALVRSGGQWSTNAGLAECEFLTAAMDLWPDDPLSQHLESTTSCLPSWAQDEDEHLEPRAFSLTELQTLAAAGQLQDMKTVAAIQLLESWRAK